MIDFISQEHNCGFKEFTLGYMSMIWETDEVFLMWHQCPTKSQQYSLNKNYFLAWGTDPQP